MIHMSHSHHCHEKKAFKGKNQSRNLLQLQNPTHSHFSAQSNDNLSFDVLYPCYRYLLASLINTLGAMVMMAYVCLTTYSLQL